MRAFVYHFLILISHLIRQSSQTSLPPLASASASRSEVGGEEFTNLSGKVRNISWTRLVTESSLFASVTKRWRISPRRDERGQRSGGREKESDEGRREMMDDQDDSSLACSPPPTRKCKKKKHGFLLCSPISSSKPESCKGTMWFFWQKTKNTNRTE